jgi:type I restriction enzyme M protein
LWIQLFYSALNGQGRAGFIMANSASDARHSEQAIRQKLLQTGAVDVMIAIGSNFFYTVTLPCTLWFLDKAKAGMSTVNGKQATVNGQPPSRSRETVLFIDARRIFRQISRAHRDFTPAQLQFVADIVRLYREQPVDLAGRQIPISGWNNGAKTLADLFPDNRYADVPGLCKVATLAEIEQQGWSLNPGRYVGVAENLPDEDFDFFERLEELNEELELLNMESRKLEETIASNVGLLFEG